ncbi:hypothetical protein, partial [Roseovarius spongiae]|uniref:hypothetical protein n=1 Tax=Roseovarius spongiae TaxID=2320272 RepID=UPI001981ACAD
MGVEHRAGFQVDHEISTTAPSRIFPIRVQRSERQLISDSVEKHRVADAENLVVKGARAPFLSGFAHLLRCRKNLGQFPK